MKAISLTQPWATLVAVHAKRIETRSWSTAYRGPIAIHAAKGFPRACRDLCAEQPFLRELTRSGWSMPELPRGAIIAVAVLKDVAPTQSLRPKPPESIFGDYSFGRFGWLLSDVIQTAQPISCRGMLGLWTVPLEIEQQLPTLFASQERA